MCEMRTSEAGPRRGLVGAVANFRDASEEASSGERERPGAARVSSPRLDRHVRQASFGSLFAIGKHLRVVRFEPLELA